MSLRTRLNERRRIKSEFTATRRAIEAERRSLLEREGIVDVIERANAGRFNFAHPERTVTFGLIGPPRRSLAFNLYRDGSVATRESGNPCLDTCGRPEPTVERRH